MPRWPIGETLRYDGTVHPLIAALPHYHLVPKEQDEHLEYRLNLRKLARNKPAMQQQLRQWCSEDPLFFINSLCWITEPREDEDMGDEEPVVLTPFNTWCHQDPIIAALARYMGRRDVCGDKSRAQGASWIVVALYAWRFMFRKHQVLGFMSKDEGAADDHTDPNSLGWKFDFIFRNLPEWMRPPSIEPLTGRYRSTSNHTWSNPLTGSVISGFAANKTSARSGRATSFFLDEAAFFGANRDAEAIDNLQWVTNNRIVISTPNGKGNEFYKLIHTPSNWLTIVLDWRDNPVQKRGLYTSEKGELKRLDADYKHDEDYKFTLDERIRSPWYDEQCARAKFNMVAIAREIDRDYGGSVGRPFPPESLDTVRQYCRTEDLRGELTYERADLSAIDHMRFATQTEGCLKLWITLDAEGLPPAGDYCVNCDVAAGTGSDTSSNSAISIWNSAGEQVGEYASNRVSPTKLAQYAIALCYWFGRGRPSSFLNWEKTGPLGTQFSNEVVRRQAYPNVYIAPEKKVRRTAKVRVDKNKRPGHHTAKTSETLEPLVSAFINQSITPRSFDLVRECSEYEFGKGDWVHPGAKNLTDESVSGFNHGDRAVAAGVAVISMIDRKWLKTAQQLKKKPAWDSAPKYSLAGRARLWESLRQATQRATSCRW